MNLFDLHCDTIGECYMKNKALSKNDLNISLEKSKIFEKYAQVFAIFVDDKYDEKQSFDYFNNVYNNFVKETINNSDIIEHCTDRLSDNKISAILSLENGKLLDSDLDKIDFIYEKGVRLVTLTWNGNNSLGNGSLSGFDGGLTPFGKKAVRYMQEKGIVIDVSHLNDKGFYDVAKIAVKPFVASHSNSRSVCNHPRNLTDEQIKIIGEFQGLIGINFYNLFLGSGNKFNQIQKHIDKIINIADENVVALGSDFDGAEIDVSLNSLEKVENLYNFLNLQGFDANLCDNIFYKNAYNYFTKWL